jgi:hypothetical protein
MGIMSYKFPITNFHSVWLFLPTQIFIDAATIVLPFRQKWAGELKTSTAMNISVFQDVFRLEKPNFHKELQVTNFELRMRSSALFQSATIYVNLSIFFLQINADLFLADSRWFIFCAHLRFQSANICVNCFFWIFSPTPQYSPKLLPS